VAAGKKTATKHYLCGLEQGQRFQQKWIVVDVVAVVVAKMLAAVVGSVVVALLLQGI
jgi:integral membrane sensor domain MASE1